MAWAMLQRFRVAMVRAERDRLSGDVEVDETLVGGVQHGGKRGRGTAKSIVVIAVEVRQPKGFGRARMRHVPDASGANLLPFVCDVVASGTVVRTDGWDGYNDLPKHGYTRQRTVLSSSDDPAHISMPGVHRVASLLKRWILGTHTRARSPPPTCSPTWRSSPSASTAARHVVAASSSAASSNKPSSPGP